MQTINREEVETYVLNLAKRVSGEDIISPDDLVYGNLFISGWDAVSFYEDIEKEFNIDLRPITQTTYETKTNWLSKSRRKIVGRDLSLKEIVEFIASKAVSQQLRRNSSQS